MRLRVSVIVVLVCVNSASAQEDSSKKSWIGRFFSSVPPPDTIITPPLLGYSTKSDTTIVKKKWEFRPTVTLPAFKLVESTREDSNVDVFVLTSVGGGISLQKLKHDGKKWKSQFSWSPLTILLSGNLNAEDTSLDLSIASTLGFFNNLLMVGGGYDLGSVKNRSRFFGLLSVGINFNN